ncbi:hypothetical protein [Rhodopirellula sp. SWK7]|uniref:hypothetical protein n=1 Tax=Rhodopirellula sp. SWK7 TaxID=595460 RepID=UPI0002BE9A74|nr:hypothetical protein [Rhodopirellula sp. SWK7]EMI42536.1 signal peptide protein [Rhodopirellula sp. SWK7]
MFRHPLRHLRLLSPDARFYRRIGMVVLFGLSSLSVSTAMAQNGSFLESLFRSIAEKQMREARERTGQPDTPTPAPQPRDKPSETTGGFPAGPLGPAKGQPRPTSPPPQVTPPREPSRPRQPDTRRDPARPSDDASGFGRPQDSRYGRRPPSRVDPHPHDVHELDLTLTQFQNELTQLMQTVQSAARSNRDFRAQLPELYQLRAEVGALISQAEASSSLAPLVPAYRGIDQRYREVSFRLRSVPDRDQTMRRQIARCDATCRTLAGICEIAPQFDRHGLHDQMVIAATYIQTLIDDLPDARMPSDRSRELIHEARLLRQAILEEADHLPSLSYDEIVTNFTNFVARWRPFAESVARYHDPILDRRLARVTQCGDETYALLWMAPPPSGLPPVGIPEMDREKWMSDAAALEGVAEYFYADMKRLQHYLRPDDYARSLVDHAHDLYEAARSIHSHLEAGQPYERLQRPASQLALAWQALASELEHVDHHGLTGRRAYAVLQQQQQMLPLVASLTAALLQDSP